MRTLIAAAMVAMLLLAGCTDSTLAAPPEDETFQDLETGPVAKDKGVIRGVVVDETVAPLANAKIVLVNQDQETRTNKDGAFVFSDLEPGPYFLAVSALGYKKVQSSTTVEAGVEKPAAVRILLEADPAGTPYYSDLVFAGFIQCSVRTPAAGVAVCGAVNDLTGLGDDRYSAMYETGGNVTHLQTEMMWKNTQQLGDAFSMAHRYGTQEDYDGGFYSGSLASGKGPSPLLIVTPAEDYNENQVGQGEQKFMTSVFATDSATAPGVGLALQQKYTVYIHEFHGYAPPEGWRFTDASEVPAPGP